MRPGRLGFSDQGASLIRRRVRYYHALIALIAVMFAAELTMHFTHQGWSRWLLTAIALVATALAMGSGLTPADLGLTRDTFGRGLRVSVVIVPVVIAAIAIGLMIAPVRKLFHNEVYRDLNTALLSAFALIPLQTVISEELLFRGVLLDALLRHHSARVAVGVQAIPFGLWHIVSSTGLSESNAGIGEAAASPAPCSRFSAQSPSPPSLARFSAGYGCAPAASYRRSPCTGRPTAPSPSPLRPRGN